MLIKQVLESDKIEYDKFVSRHPRGTFLQSWGWGEWQKEQKKLVNRYFFMRGNVVIGAVQAILMKTPMGNYLYCPYGPLWDVDLEEVDVKNLFNLLKEELEKEANIFFIRIEPTIQADLKKLGAIKAESVQPPQTLIKNIIAPEDELLKSFHQKTRYNIKVAQRHNIKVSVDTNINDNIIDLILKTSARQKYRNHSSGYIRNMWQFFKDNPGNVKLSGYIARKDNTPLSSGLMVDYGTTRMYLFGGSDYEHRNFMGPYLMHWQAMLDAKRAGLSQYDFGASENASGHSGGYMRFKMGFNPQVVNFSGTHDIVIKHSKYKIYRAIRILNRIRLHLPI